MVAWLKNNWGLITTMLVGIVVTVFLYSCEPKVPSLNDGGKIVNRQELQLELNQLIELAKIRMADLDKQDQLRAIVLQNALVLVQGQPLNPVGIISAIAALYGIAQGGKNITQVVKKKVNGAKATNGTA